MISRKDYVKPLNQMNEQEKKSYLERVVRWTDETYPQLCALVDSYDATTVKDFDEGLKLASALAKAKDFVSNAYRYDARKRLERINMLLREVREKSGLSKLATRRADDKRHYTAHITPPPTETEEEAPRDDAKQQEQKQGESVAGRRPEHLSQYIDKLSDTLRKEAMEIASRYDMLYHWRGRAEYLADDPRATQEMIAEAAQNAVKYEQQILNFWERVDAEYAKQTGQRVDPEYTARLDKEAAVLNKEVEKKAGEYTKAEIDAMTDEEKREACKMARIQTNQKFLRRSDIQLTEERKAQIILRANELAEWGIILTKKQQDTVEKAIPEQQDSKQSDLFANNEEEQPNP